MFLAPGYDRPYSLGTGRRSVGRRVFVGRFPRRRARTPRPRTALAAAVSGKNVVVVGGGAVAMDCAVTAKRLGADRVYAVSLEAMEELPADEDEKDLAFREGIRFKPNGG